MRAEVVWVGGLGVEDEGAAVEICGGAGADMIITCITIGRCG